MSMKDDNDEVLKNTYKLIKLYPELSGIGVDHRKRNPTDKGKFISCVSFNTVPSCLGSSSLDDAQADFPGVQIPPEFSLNDFYDSNLADTHNDYFSHRDYMDGHKISSPLPRRKTRRSLADVFRVSENGKIVRIDYPTRPAIINDAFIMTRSQRQWRQLWDLKKAGLFRRLEEEDKWFQYPEVVFPLAVPFSKVMSIDGFTPLTKEQRRKEKVIHTKIDHPTTPRLILCHISGRAHTWVALDWALRQLAQDTDHVVVVANLPRLTGTNGVSNSRSASLGRFRSRSRLRSDVHHGIRSLSVGPRTGDNEAIHEDFIEWTSGYTKKSVEMKVKDIFRYIQVILPTQLAVKITVEIVLGKTKKIMLDAINCYTPDFCVESTLKWERTDNLIVWKSRYLKDVLCTKFPVPTFVVPAKRMYDFESKMEREFQPDAGAMGGTPLGNIISAPELTKASSSGTSTDPVKFDSRDSLALNHSGITDGSAQTSDTESKSEGQLALKEKMRLARQRHRENILTTLHKIETDKTLKHSDKQIGKLDGILNETLYFSLELQNMSQEDFQGKPEELNLLKKIITGGTNAAPNSKKSMLDVPDTPKYVSHHHHRHRRSSSHHTKADRRPSRKTHSGQIKFASNVNARDGYQALGNSRGKPHLDLPRPLLGPHSFSQNNLEDGDDADEDDMELRRVSSAGSTITLRKIKSANNVVKTKSNESLSPTRSHDYSSVVHHHKDKGSSGSGSGWLSLFKTGGSRSRSRSRSQSRRNSSGSEGDQIGLSDSTTDGKKKKSFFGW